MASNGMGKERDTLSKARDGAIIAGGAGLAVGGVTAGVAAHKAGKEIKKGVSYVGDAANKVGRAARRTTPKAVADQVVKRAKSGTKKRVKKAFPTLSKVAGKAVRVLTKKRGRSVSVPINNYQTAASGLIQFLDPGVYHGARGLKKVPVFNHEYVMVVPKDEKKLSPEARKRLRKVGPDGQKALVSGAYNRAGRKNRKLKARLGENSDVKAARKAAEKGKLRKVGIRDSDKAANKIVDINSRYKERDYPGVWKNVRSKGENSNTYARSVLRKVGAKKVEGHKRAPGKDKMALFETPASGLISFGKQNQPRQQGTNRFVDPLEVAAGTTRGYTKGLKGEEIRYDPGFRDVQVVNAALRKGKKARKYVQRGGGMVRDAVDSATGKDRRKDAAGRAKKKEWEKPWFKNAATAGALGAGVLGEAALRRNVPEYRNVRTKAETYVGSKVDKVLRGSYEGAVKNPKPPTSKEVRGAVGAVGRAGGRVAKRVAKGGWARTAGRFFDTPASGLISFTSEAAREKGWDVRDPRGKSARVFAPGSKKRQRREKSWGEKIENERKVRNAIAVGVGALGVAAGVAAGNSRAMRKAAITRRRKKIMAKRDPDKNKVVKFNPKAG